MTTGLIHLLAKDSVALLSKSLDDLGVLSVEDGDGNSIGDALANGDQRLPVLVAASLGHRVRIGDLGKAPRSGLANGNDFGFGWVGTTVLGVDLPGQTRSVRAGKPQVSG